MTSYLYTKQQTIQVLNGWGVDMQPPKKGKEVVVSFAPSNAFVMAKVEWLETPKSTYDERLYRITLYTKAECRTS